MSRKSQKTRARTSVTLADGAVVIAQWRVDPFGESYLYATGKDFKGLKADNSEELIDKCTSINNVNNS